MTSTEHIERALLGGCLLEDPEMIDLVSTTAQPEHFYLDSHQRIAKVVFALHSVGSPVNSVTIPQELDKRNELASVGGRAYLSDLTDGLPRHFSAKVTEDLIARLKEAWRKRELAILSEELALHANESESDSHALIQNTAARLEAIASDSDDGDAAVSAVTMSVLEEIDRERDSKESTGIRFGIPDLDSMMTLRDGHQSAIGASSGIGKTTLLAQILHANKHVPTVAFLLEPTKAEVLRKVYSIESGVRYGALVDPRFMSTGERQSVREAAFRVAEWPMRLHDAPSLTLDRVLTLGRLSIHRYGTRLIAVDYIQRLKVKTAESGETTRLKIARASTAMADLVKKTCCHSILLSQLTTGRKNGAQAKPTMYDFRESSQIENDAHNIILLHRNFDEDQGHYSDEGAIMVPKVRFGVPCNLKAKFDPKMAVWKGVS